MASRVPTASPFTNTKSGLSLVIGKGANPRIIHIRPWLSFSLGIIAAALLCWYMVATLYWVFRDEMLARLLNQQTEMQYAYEDRLASLRNQIDKVTSRQLLDQNSLEGKLHELISRQAQLETRHAIVAGLSEQPALAGARLSTSPKLPTPLSSSDRVTSPLTTGSISSFAPIGSKPVPDDQFEIRNLNARNPRATGGPETQTNPKRLNQSSLPTPLPPAAIAIYNAKDLADQMERQQIATLESMERGVREKAKRWSAIFAETGLEAERFMPAQKKSAAVANNSAMGGPLVAVAASKNSGPFEQKLVQLQQTIKLAEQMRRIVTQLPIERPLPAEYDISSNYGARTDPFTRGSAMHTGMDFRAPTGASVRATAPGTVVEAGVNGGYGKMVEVEHGGGLTTRYAHLSSLDVAVGDRVNKGTIIGRVGSTGRSTGPHLHYETRIDGDATDPSRFIRAGQKFGVR
jgi:murein DD-endopeptidase MepM/ murein hydrolase activator NlpD